MDDKDKTIAGEVKTTFHDSDNPNEFIIAETTEIPSSFLDWTHDMREADAQYDRFGNRMVCMAAIPPAVANKWMREGFDVFKEPAAAILKRLRDEDLQAFITSNRKL